MAVLGSSGTMTRNSDGDRCVLRLFNLTDTTLLKRDAQFWTLSLDTYLQLYLRTRVESEEDKHNKALVCAKLAGLGLALAEHFGRGVQSLDNVESPSMEAAGADAFQKLSKHTDRLEAATKKVVS